MIDALNWLAKALYVLGGVVQAPLLQVAPVVPFQDIFAGLSTASGPVVLAFLVWALIWKKPPLLVPYQFYQDKQDELQRERDRNEVLNDQLNRLTGVTTKAVKKIPDPPHATSSSYRVSARKRNNGD